MKKFLQISGIVFWVQLIIVFGVAIYWLTLADGYEEEVEQFTLEFIEDIFKEEKHAALESYFSDSFSGADTLRNALEKLGQFQDCQSSLATIEATEKVAEIEMDCLFLNAGAEFDVEITKEEGFWKITGATVTSDVFRLGL